MATSRNRFRSGGSPLRVQQTALTPSQLLAQQATDLRNQATVDELTNPLVKQLAQLTLQDALRKLTDPYIKFVADLNRQRSEVQDRDALRKLAEGDPYGFIRYAEEKLLGIPQDDMAYGVWQQLLDKAYNKAEDEQWASWIKNGDKSLKDFDKFLNQRLSEYPQGSAEAAQVLNSITQNKTAIKAQDEAIKDQAAFTEYINSSNHQKYADYLNKKLARSTDIEVSSTIMQQLGELQVRMEREKEADRRRRLSETYSDYRGRKISAAEAVSIIEALGNEQITPQEATSIQSTINAIFENEQQIAAQGRASRVGAVAQEFSRDIAYYNRTKETVDAALKSGDVPTPEMLRDLQLAGYILGTKYEMVAEFESSVAGVAARMRDASEIREFVDTLPNKIDDNRLKGINISESGRRVFQDQLDAIPDPNVRAEKIVERLLTVSVAKDKLITTNAQRDADQDITTWQSAALESARDLATKPAELTPSEENSLAVAHLEYITNVSQQNADANKTNPYRYNIPTVGRDEFAKFVAQAQTPEALRAMLRMDGAPPDTAFQVWKKAAAKFYSFDPESGGVVDRRIASWDPMKDDFIGNDKAVSAARKATEIARKTFSATNRDMTTPTDPELLWNFARGTLDINGLRQQQLYKEQENEQNYFRARYGNTTQAAPGSALPQGGSWPQVPIYQSPSIGGATGVTPMNQEPGGQLPYTPGPQPMVDPEFDPNMMGSQQFRTPSYKPRPLEDEEDPIQFAIDYLDADVDLELPSFSLPQLPSFGPFLQEFEYGSDFDPGSIDYPSFDYELTDMQVPGTNLPTTPYPTGPTGTRY